jgi:hypothetical protein
LALAGARLAYNERLQEQDVLVVHDIEADSLIWTCYIRGRVTALEFDRLGDCLAVGTDDGCVTLYRAADGERLAQTAAPGRWRYSRSVLIVLLAAWLAVWMTLTLRNKKAAGERSPAAWKSSS